MKLTLYSITLCAALSICSMATAQVFYPNGAVHDYLDISYPHHRFEPFTFCPLIIDAGVSEDVHPRFNHRWHGVSNDRFVVSRNWWIPYPVEWPLWDNGVAWVVANYAIDGNLNGVPDYFEWDYNGDGHIDISDLSYFGDEYNDRWDLSDLSAMGTIYNARREL